MKNRSPVKLVPAWSVIVTKRCRVKPRSSLAAGSLVASHLVRIKSGAVNIAEKNNALSAPLSAGPASFPYAGLCGRAGKGVCSQGQLGHCSAWSWGQPVPTGGGGGGKALLPSPLSPSRSL